MVIFWGNKSLIAIFKNYLKRWVNCRYCGKTGHFGSLVGMCNLVSVEPTVQAHGGIWEQHRTTRDSLCQPEERRKGIYSLQPCGDRWGGLLWRIQHPQALAWSRKGGKQRTGRRLRIWGGREADRIILQGSMLWHKDPYFLSSSLSGEFVFCLWVLGERGGN